MPLGRGQVFAGYTIVRLLGSGGMGEVYLAKHPRLPRHDALKVLPADVSADPEFRSRSTAKPIWPPRCFIRTLSACMTEVSSRVNCGSLWTTWRAPTRGS
jgi:serine/threonine protein kinase